EALAEAAARRNVPAADVVALDPSPRLPVNMSSLAAVHALDQAAQEIWPVPGPPTCEAARAMSCDRDEPARLRSAEDVSGSRRTSLRGRAGPRDGTKVSWHPASPASHPCVSMGQPANRWAALGFITLAVMTSVIDNSVMTVATPSIASSFHATLEAVEWASSSYALVFGATMLLWGKLGALHGHRRMFIAGNLVFAVGSMLVGASPTIGTMIAMRALQGVGAAMYNPASIALIALIFSGRDRPLAYGINGMTASVGVALGYVLGGFCAEYVHWSWAFYVNLPIASMAAWGAWRYVPDVAERAERG